MNQNMIFNRWNWVVILGSISLVIIYFLFFRFSPDNWSIDIPNVGFTSSTRQVDLNEDGILDLVIGGGGEEFTYTENGVTAIDGKDGEVLWKVAARNQVVGSAVFQDINLDGTPEVFIGGRSAILFCIDGKSGRMIWEYLPDFDTMDLLNDTTLLNFTTPQWIPDADGDGLDDLVVSFGGFIKAKSFEKNRPAGSLKVISSNNGKVLAKILMPDHAEAYMSPLVHDFLGNGNLTVIFGSGGETINGHLYKMPLSDLLQNSTSTIQTLASGKGKGFIAPPVIADVNLDGIKDIVANPVNGNMICINGKTNDVIWELQVGSGFEVYVSPTPGYFSRNDKVPDFFTSMGAGPWPYSEFTKHILVDGENGQIVFSDTLGIFQYASSVVFDFDRDGNDDILFAINDRQILEAISKSALFFVNDLKVLNFQNNSFYNLGRSKLGSNLGTTPLITDLDGDQWVDIIYCYMEDANNFYSFQKGKIERLEIRAKDINGIPWGSYMGKGSNSIFLNIDE